ncbi:MAG: tetratricopeptide repeat protein [Bacteroidales bacterium]
MGYMNRKVFWPSLLFIAFLTNCIAYGQVNIIDNQIDSLRKELNIREGAKKVATQLELAFHLLERDISEAKNLATSAQISAQTLKERSLEMRAYYILGRADNALWNMDSAIDHYEKALKLASTLDDNWNRGEILYRIGGIKRSNGDEIGALESYNESLQACRLSSNFRVMGSTYSMMGTVFRVNGLYDRAIEYTVNAKLNYEKAGLKEGYAWSAYILGRIYLDMGLNEKALDYFQEAVDIYALLASANDNREGFAICYEQIALIYIDQGNYQEAYNYIDSTLQIYTASNSALGVSNSYKKLGMIDYHRGDYKSAMKYFQKALATKIEIGDLLSITTIYQYMGLCMIAEGRTKEGFANLQKGLEFAVSNNQTKIELNIYSDLTRAYLTMNDLANAIEYQGMQIEIQNQLLSGGANIKLEQLQTIYELDRQHTEILELEKQNEINSLLIKQHRILQLIMIAGILIAVLFSITLIWFYKRIRLTNHKLKETNAAKDKFFAIISHDLRGPTISLASFIQHLSETSDEYSPEELKDLLLKLNKSAKNMSLLLDNLLLWAQTQLNKIEFSPVELKLTDVIQNSIIGIRQSADNKQIDIRLDLEDNIRIVADSMMVQTIVRNILSNAIKFTHRGGTVVINSAAMDPYNAIVIITDNGIGIEKGAISKLFDISSTQYTTGTEDEKSSGLGLVLVKEFIDRNHGTIIIESQKDKGTVVTITLPLARDS